MEKKYRHEYKYTIDSCQAAILETRASMLIQRDAHAGADGTYVIKSLYFDDYNDSCFWEKEDGYNERSKFRIRYYDNDTQFMRLEKKSKKNGMTCKESCFITAEMCRSLMQGHIPEVREDMSQMMQNLFSEMRLRSMVPKVIVVYERKPYVCSMGNVRVTFDRKLSSSNDIAHFLEEDIVLRPIMQKGQSLLEVKWDELLPEYISEHLSLESLQWSAFSKYCLCRKYDCYGGLNL